MTRLLLLDSGAYAVWNLGSSINLDEYIAFCRNHPDVSYYVNLDVIPGEKGRMDEVTREGVEAACRSGWENYRRMCGELPPDKVIPVFHHNDDLKWLAKYLDAGCRYVGLGGISSESTANRLSFLQRVKPLLFDGAGRSVVKVHGFGMTNFDMMRYWQWHSVDSTSWKATGAWGCIYLPRRKGGEYDYSLNPYTVGVSPMKTCLAKTSQTHVLSMSPGVRADAMEYLKSEGLEFGEWVVEKVPDEYKIVRGSEEYWYDKKRRLLLRTIVKGVATSFEQRCIANSRLFKRANKVLPVDHIFFAGLFMPYPLEFQLGRRLLSYHDLDRKTGHSKMIERHVDSMKQYEGKVK